MSEEQNNIDWNLLHFCRAHPWHGVPIGSSAPEVITSYIEIVQTDTVKFELDKQTGLLTIDRPQKYSNYCPSLYGMIPQTYAGRRVGEHCSKMTNRPGIKGDGDPLDICVLTEKPILRGDILLQAVPIGGLRALDNHEADDKIIAVLKDDLVYKNIRDVSDCPKNLIERLEHYFLTYKESPKELSDKAERRMEISHIYHRAEALEIIRLAQLDYQEKFADMLKLHQTVQ